jgi:hypothetical protein
VKFEDPDISKLCADLQRPILGPPREWNLPSDPRVRFALVVDFLFFVTIELANRVEHRPRKRFWDYSPDIGE